MIVRTQLDKKAASLDFFYSDITDALCLFKFYEPTNTPPTLSLKVLLVFPTDEKAAKKIASMNLNFVSVIDCIVFLIHATVQVFDIIGKNEVGLFNNDLFWFFH